MAEGGKLVFSAIVIAFLASLVALGTSAEDCSLSCSERVAYAVAVGTISTAALLALPCIHIALPTDKRMLLHLIVSVFLSIWWGVAAGVLTSTLCCMERVRLFFCRRDPSPSPEVYRATFGDEGAGLTGGSQRKPSRAFEATEADAEAPLERERTSSFGRDRGERGYPPDGNYSTRPSTPIAAGGDTRAGHTSAFRDRQVAPEGDHARSAPSSSHSTGARDSVDRGRGGGYSRDGGQWRSSGLSESGGSVKGLRERDRERRGDFGGGRQGQHGQGLRVVLASESGHVDSRLMRPSVALQTSFEYTSSEGSGQSEDGRGERDGGGAGQSEGSHGRGERERERASAVSPTGSGGRTGDTYTFR
uniref:Transmembrane protein n=1 Tax=Chromera velia CCMP2878 TaxID=1169474 RepID=A0A0G4G8P7_9ALVE|eukprot:Cvel_20769.t1-p1 / transcript=Cvel_20769.t1 / gene=Cvel_20769 / organism=Chromera_velia_CCMP2878 / gene_product=hypothetical protein / transcript_product=hypothetical protein / location=Cvel_scaffold1894:26491-28616(-) / protein_length=360 / sequence_SO=supercontig / SO=protein_coding / is_pseudo=false